MLIKGNKEEKTRAETNQCYPFQCGGFDFFFFIYKFKYELVTVIREIVRNGFGAQCLRLWIVRNGQEKGGFLA